MTSDRNFEVKKKIMFPLGLFTPQAEELYNWAIRYIYRKPFFQTKFYLVVSNQLSHEEAWH